MIHYAGAAPWLHPLGTQHHCPLISVLLKLTDRGVIGSGTWHGLALAGHGVNIILLWLILTRLLAVARPYAWAITMLFALNASGFEATVWAGCLGYVLVETTILMAIGLALAAGPQSKALVRWGMLLLQIVAFAIWDWGLLLLPIVAASYLLYHWPRKTCRPAEAAGLLWPMAAGWALMVVLVKLSFGYSPGYAIAFDPVHRAYYLLTAPVRCLYPNGLYAFYHSRVGLGLALAVLVVLALGSWLDLRIRLLAGLFLLCQVPYILLSGPESRYCYLSSAFLFAAVVLPLAGGSVRAWKMGLLVVLVGFHAFWSWQRADLWKTAYREAQAVRMAVDAAAPGDSRTPLVVVNLPDSYGPPGLMWRPYMWRNGLTAFGRQIIRVNTPGSPLGWAESGIAQVPREQIRSRYPDSVICEVMFSREDDWRHLEVRRWSAGR
jgi:hypothetical protein